MCVCVWERFIELSEDPHVLTRTGIFDGFDVLFPFDLKGLGLDVGDLCQWSSHGY